MSKKAPTIAEFMTRSTLTISHSASLNEAHELMRRHQIRHLPVVSQNEVIGVVSIRDLHL
ncbi:MAG: CBS domain-containing protein, partial [Deltaproteobacteria bacterium]|nr:CBS domain-containing protein [Deltaproteobacteria bacterium]